MTRSGRRREPICLTTWRRELRIGALALTAAALLCGLGVVVAPAVGLHAGSGRLAERRVANETAPTQLGHAGARRPLARPPRARTRPSATGSGSASRTTLHAGRPAASPPSRRPIAPGPASPAGAPPQAPAAAPVGAAPPDSPPARD